MGGISQISALTNADSAAVQETPRVSALAVWDREFNLVCWSETCLAYWFEPGEFLRSGMPMIELLLHLAHKGVFGEGSPQELAECELKRLKAAGPDSDDDFRMPDGRTIRVSRNSLAGGGHASSYIDATEYLKAKEVRDSRVADYRLAASISNVGHWLWDEVKQEMISCSEQCARIHGVSIEEFLHSASTREGDIGWVHPADRQRYRDAFLSQKSYDIEFRIIAEDGQVRHVREVSEPEYDDEGNVVRSRGIIQDISVMMDTREALETSVRRYQEIFDEAPTALWVEDWSKVKAYVEELLASGVTDLKTYFENNRDKLCHAYDLAETVETSRASLALYGTDDKSMYMDYLSSDEALPEELDVFAEILIGLTQEKWHFETESEDTTWLGHNIIVLSRGVIPPAYRDDWSRLIYSMEDVTEKRKAQAEREIAVHNAEKANRAKTVFLANMSHELRTPLNAIIGYSDAIAQQMFGPVGNDKYLEYINDVNMSGRHLLELVNDVLDISKVEAGAESIEEVEIELGDMIRTCLPLVSVYKRAETLHFDVNVPEVAPRLRADERLVKQILINILSNAVKFSKEDGVVGVSLNIHPRNAIHIVIEDCGVGIAVVDIPKVLEPFGQARTGEHQYTEGTGLGLPLAKRLMELHGGTLRLESRLGHGTTVTLCFPPERTVTTD